MSWLRRIARAAVVVAVLGAALGATLGAAGCSSVSTVRVQPDNLYVGPGMKPIAVIHAQVTSGYLLFIPIPGHVDLDRVVNRMLLATAKTLGADKVVNIRVDITPDGGIWTLRKLFLWRSAEASGVAVVIEDKAGEPRPAAPATAGKEP
jgi:hypothetical protein